METLILLKRFVRLTTTACNESLWGCKCSKFMKYPSPTFSSSHCLIFISATISVLFSNYKLSMIVFHQLLHLHSSSVMCNSHLPKLSFSYLLCRAMRFFLIWKVRNLWYSNKNLIFYKTCVKCNFTNAHCLHNKKKLNLLLVALAYVKHQNVAIIRRKNRWDFFCTEQISLQDEHLDSITWGD